jgi:hypothetical protein
VNIAKGCLAHPTQSAIGAGFLDGFNLHEQSSLLGARHMEGSVTVGLMTLDASALTALLTDVTGETLASRRDALKAVNGF